MEETISEKLDYLYNTQSQIKSAIISKGVDVSDSDPFMSYGDKIRDISSVDPNALLNVTELPSNGTISLEAGKVYMLNADGDLTFSLPIISSKTKFPQILIQLNMTNPVTIDLGTHYFFNQKTPDLSNSGMYNIIYEYDLNQEVWVVNIFEKGLVA